MTSRTADVAIVGAGVIGAAIAYTLAGQSKQKIVLLDRGTAGGVASTAAAGVLAASSGGGRGYLLGLRRKALSLYPSFVEELERETRSDVGFYRCGLLSLATSPDDAESLTRLTLRRRAEGGDCGWLDRSRALELQPGLSESVIGAAFFAEEGIVDNIRLTRALLEGARRRGVEVVEGSEVTRLTDSGASCTITCGGSPQLHAAKVVVAAGVWSPRLMATMGVRVPLRASHGEMIALRGDIPLQRVVSHGLTYLVPRRGEIMIGSTNSFRGFSIDVSVGGVRSLIASAGALMPALEGARYLRCWSGLRPCPTIRRPIVAGLPEHPNVVLATGHHRNGILLAPLTARLVTQILLGSSSDVSLRPLAYRRR